MMAPTSKLTVGMGTAAGALAAVLAVSCGDDFTDCTASRTCPDSVGGAGGEAGADGTAGTMSSAAGSSGKAAVGGSDAGGSGGRAEQTEAGRGGDGPAPSDGGEAGQAGEAGTGGQVEPPAACERDSDCRDDNACDGIETCEAGRCAEGTPFTCTSDEPEQCDAVCETVEGVATCRYTGRDADRDGYRSAACTLSPGDDCNDADDAIHPGAAEMCDGVDSDCDQLADPRETEVEVSGEVDVIVAANESSPKLGAFNIAGYGETTTTTTAGTPFAIGWIEASETCRSWQTHSVSYEGARTRVASGDCDTLLVDTIDVTMRPSLVTMTTRLANPSTAATFLTVLTDASGERAVNQFTSLLRPPIYQTLSFKESEYQIVRMRGTVTETTVRRLGFNRDFELTTDTELDPAAEHLSIDGQHGAAVWTLRTSPTLDQVFGNLGGGTSLLSNATTSASHPLMAWSENHGNGIAWRYADGTMTFKHYEESCAVNVGHGFPGELAATSAGFVLISLSDDRAEVVASLVQPNCQLGPRTVLARAEGDTLSDPKVAVTGQDVRAVWKRTRGVGVTLESRQFSWKECE